MMVRVRCLIAAAILVGSVAGMADAQTSEPLPSYAQLLPQVRKKALAVDPEKGFLVKLLKPGIYMITDGGYESVFVTTGRGVVLFDAPPSFARHISEAVAETTKEPIVELVYTHVHVDHIGGASLILAAVPMLKIVAEDGVAEFLRELHDPHRPVPTETFRDHEILSLGTMTADLRVGHWHSPEGDLLIDFPAQKVVIAIDALSSGAVPFMGFDLTMNMHDYLKIFDQLMAMDFDVMVPGHHSVPADHEDVRIARDYVNDVYHTMQRILAQDHSALRRAAVAKYGAENSFAVAGVMIEREQSQCAQEIQRRWKNRLEDVDVWAESHCHTALVYAEWDVGSR
jgi:glyoxylase-like metal-dependent hydrolase (beta-lactamase superfamily II)